MYHGRVKLPVGAAPLASLACLSLAGACSGGGTRHVEIVLVAPDVPSGCGVPAGAQRADLFALGDFVEVGESGAADAPLTTARFPPTTRALRLAVLGPASATIGIGRSASFEASTLDDGGQVALLIGPPRGFCQVAPMAQARRRPTVARAGAGVLVVGGIDSQGGPVGVGEWYDPARGAFVLLPQAPFDDLRGASAVTLADGRVLITWQDGFQLYDPGAQRFGDPTLAAGVDLHSFGQAVQLADGRVLVAGGCEQRDALPPCAASTAAAIFDPESARFTRARALALARADGAAWLDGDGRVLLLGGFGDDAAPAAEGEGWQEDASVTLPTGPLGASAALPVGGWIAGFAPAGQPGGAVASLYGPLGAAGGARSAVVPRAGTTMTTLDDGAVLVVGGTDAAAPASVPEAELYRAHSARFEPLTLAPGALAGRRREHAAIRLDDGSVLIVGGVGAGEVRADAWIYRHDVTGPWSSLPAQIFAVGGTPLVLPFDAVAAHVEPGTPAQLVVTAQALRAGALGGWALLAGPLYADVTLSATLTVSTGAGAAALLGLTSAGDYLAVTLQPGQPISVAPVARGILGAPLCEGSVALADDALTLSLHALRVERRGPTLRVDLDGASVLSCEGVAGARGAVGFGVVGGAGSELRLASVEAVR